MAQVEEYRDANGNLIVRERRPTSRPLIVLLLLVVAAIAVAWLTGLISFSTSGNLEAPKVAVTGGELPQVDVNTADIDVGTKTETVEVPTVNVTPADQNKQG